MNQHISKFLSHRSTVPAIVGTVGLGVGLGCGYLWGRRSASKAQETEPAKDDNQLSLFDEEYVPYSGKPKTLRLVGLEEMLAQEEAQLLVEHVERKAEEAVQAVRVQVFPQVGSPWDYEAEMSSRDPELPYIVHVDEFMADEMGFKQTTVQYYEGDHILTDENDVPIYNFEKLFGELRFGHGSNDQNVVYIRNEKLGAEWEVLRSTDYYQSVVQGLEIEHEYAERDLKHSAVRRFRDE